MSIAQQLFHLQELDLRIESSQKSLHEMNGRLGETEEMVNLRTEFTSEKQHLEALRKEQHNLEIETGDLSVKLKDAGDELYSGRIKNPKELSNLQHDISLLSANRGKLDEKGLELMDQIELHIKKVSELTERFAVMEAAWKIDQEKLAADIETLQSEVAAAAQEKQLLAGHLDPKLIALYNDLRIKRKTAVAKVNQGICDGCRMALPVTLMQRVRGGNSIVHCSSCGRILYLA